MPAKSAGAREIHGCPQTSVCGADDVSLHQRASPSAKRERVGDDFDPCVVWHHFE